MALTHTDEAANTALDAMYDQFDGGKLRIFSGAAPGAGAAESGTLLVSEDLPADAFAAAASGSKAKLGTWQAVGLAAGVAGYFRLVAAGDTGAASEAQAREEGTVTATGGGGDMTLDNTSIAVDQVVTITGYTRTK